MARRIHPVFLHLAGCILFLSLPLFFSPESLTLRSYLANPPTQRDLIVYVLVLGVFYANYFLLIPAFYFTRRYLAFILLNGCCFTVLTFLPQLLVPHSFPQRPYPDFLFHPASRDSTSS